MQHVVDHLVYGTPDLEGTIRSLEARLGVRAAVGGHHPRWGTRNAVLALGPLCYLEILAPDPARPHDESPTLFGLDRLASPRLVAWATATSDLEARVEAAARRGVCVGAVGAGSREMPGGGVLSWRLTDPETVLGDGVVPFLIDWGASRHPAAGAPRAGTLVALRAEHPDPDRVRRLLHAVGVRLDVAPGPEPALIANLRTSGGTVELR
jgi:hypothetical protein